MSDVPLEPCDPATLSCELTIGPLASAIAAFGSIALHVVPFAPVAPVLVSSSITRIVLRWSAPATDGGSPITGYAMQMCVGDMKETKESDWKQVYSGALSECVVDGLLVGSAYQFRAIAANQIGTSPPSGVTHLTTKRPREFRYVSDFDTNGLLYYLGTGGGQTAWANPARTSPPIVTCTTSGLHDGSPENICDRSPATTRTSSGVGAWHKIDLGAHSILPTHYTLRHGYDNKNYSLRNWQLQGSTDGTTWMPLRTHVDDMSLNAAWATASWPIAAVTVAYRYFRILAIGPGSHPNRHALCGFELYGESATCA